MSTYNPPRDDGNHRVSNAILSTKLDRLILDVQDMCAKMDKRMAFLEEKFEVEVSDLRGRCQENSTGLARLDERQKAWTGILGALTVFGSAVGSLFGFVK